MARSPGWNVRPVCTSRPSESKTRTAPNSASTGSLKRRLTCSGAALEPRAALRRRGLQQRVGARRLRQQRERHQRESERPDHQASARGCGAGERAPRRRRSDHQRDQAADQRQRQAGGGKRGPEQRPGDRAFAAVDGDRDLPVVDLRAHVLVRDRLGVLLGHPVHAMVVPLEAARARDLLPARRALAVDAVRHRDLAVALLVDVVRLGVGVDRHGAVGLDAGVRLAVVALDHHGAVAAVAQQQPVVAVEDLDVDAGGGRRDLVDL